MTLETPFAYFDPRGNDYQHVVIARWKYNRAVPDNDAGGLDGMGIAIDDVVVGDSALIYRAPGSGDDCTLFYDFTPSERDRRYGVVHREQDGFEFDCGYTWYQGQLSMRFNIHDCDSLLFDSKMAHSWETSDVTGASFSVGTGGVSISFQISNSQHSWTTTPENTADEYPPCA